MTATMPKDLWPKGRYQYRGNKATSIAGLECDSWENVENDQISPNTWWTHYKDNFLSNGESYCRNAWDSSLGPFCPLKMRYAHGAIVLASCGIPSCSEMRNRETRMCLIRSLGSVGYQTYGDTDHQTYQDLSLIHI